MASWQRSKYYEDGIKAAWESLNPHQQDACFNAWFEYALQIPPNESERLGDRILIDFAWGFRWGTSRFWDSWIGLPPEKRKAERRTVKIVQATIEDMKG